LLDSPESADWNPHCTVEGDDASHILLFHSHLRNELRCPKSGIPFVHKKNREGLARFLLPINWLVIRITVQIKPCFPKRRYEGMNSRIGRAEETSNSDSSLSVALDE